LFLQPLFVETPWGMGRINFPFDVTNRFARLAGTEKRVSARITTLAAFVGLLASARQASAGSPTSIFDPAATPAHSFFGLLLRVIAALICVRQSNAPVLRFQFVML